MIKAPYYKVHIGDRDVTEYVEKLDYEDSIEEDNLVTFTIDQNYAQRLADDDDFITGNFMSFMFGFKGGAISQLHKARITDITHTYRERVSMTVKCLDLGTHVKKTTSQKIWENKTSSAIVAEIADKYGFEKEITSTTKVWDYLPQGNRSDLEFMQYLARREGDGNMIIYIRNNTLYFTKRSLSDNSKVTFTYGYGDGPLVSFTPTIKESKKSPVSNQTATTVIDEKTGEITTTVVDNDTEAEGGTTGKYRIVYGADKGNEIGEIAESNVTIGKQNLEPVADKEEAKILANNTKKTHALRTMTARLVVDGNPLLTPNAIITIKNVAKRHLGNWFITKVVNKLENSAYVTICELSSNGAKNKATSDKVAPDANTSVGVEKVEDEVKIAVYSGESGDFQEYSTKSTTVKKGGGQ